MTVWIWLFDRRRGVVNYLLSMIPGVDMNNFNWIGGRPAIFFVVASDHRHLDVGAVRRLLVLRRPHPGVGRGASRRRQLDGATGVAATALHPPADDPAGHHDRAAAQPHLGPPRLHADHDAAGCRAAVQRLRPARHLHLQAGRRRARLSAMAPPWRSSCSPSPSSSAGSTSGACSRRTRPDVHAHRHRAPRRRRAATASAKPVPSGATALDRPATWGMEHPRAHRSSRSAGSSRSTGWSTSLDAADVDARVVHARPSCPFGGSIANFTRGDGPRASGNALAHQRSRVDADRGVLLPAVRVPRGHRDQPVPLPRSHVRSSSRSWSSRCSRPRACSSRSTR